MNLNTIQKQLVKTEYTTRKCSNNERQRRNNDSNNLQNVHRMKGVGVIDAIYNILKSDKSQTHRESVTYTT